MSTSLSHVIKASNTLNALLLKPAYELSEFDSRLIDIYTDYIAYIRGNMYKRNPNLYNDMLYHIISRCSSISDIENISQKISLFKEGNVFCENTSAGGAGGGSAGSGGTGCFWNGRVSKKKYPYTHVAQE